MQHTLRQRSFYALNGRQTSVRLEIAFWDALEDIATKQKMTPAELIAHIDKEKRGALASTLRVYCLGYYRTQGC
jgi:predicted DNA-binding ribbon-helix-helix protein